MDTKKESPKKKEKMPIDEEPLEYPMPTIWENKDWAVLFTKGEMLNTSQVTLFADKININRLPDVLYGFNAVYLINPKHDFCYSASAIEALQLCNYSMREKKPLLCPTKEIPLEKIKEIVKEQNIKHSESKAIYNPINALPPAVLAKESAVWSKKDFSSIKDFQKIEIKSDWTYTTPYKGSLSYLSKTSIPHYKIPTIPPIKSSVSVDLTDAQIPFHKLGKENPVLHYDEIHLFEDDLDDLGFAQGLIRVRTMADSLYMLIRNYVRLDNMFVRIIDTRIYHEYGTDILLREFQYKENTFEELKKKGFEVSSEWVLSAAQADTIFPQLDLKIKIMDQISI